MSTIPGLAPLTIAGVNTTDGRGVVPQALLAVPMRVRIPMWQPLPAVGDEPHVVELFEDSVDGIRSLTRQTVTPPPPPIPSFHELEITVDQLRRTTRVARLYYVVTTEGGSNRMQPSIPITIDLNPPTWMLPTDALQFVVPPVPVMNAQYLQNNPRVAFNIPTYDIGVSGDRVEFYLSNQANPATGLAPAGGSLVDFTTTPWTGTLDAAAFRSLSDGTAYVFCKIFDATGNFSALSAGLPFVVGLGNVIPIPITSFPAPRVLNTLTNGNLNCSSMPKAVDGVHWLIAADARIRVGDEVTFIWQGFNENNWGTVNPNVVFRRSIIWTAANISAGATVVVDSFETTLFPLRNRTSATGSYEVRRGGVLIGTSQPGRVRVDLTYSTGCYCTPRGIICG